MLFPYISRFHYIVISSYMLFGDSEYLFLLLTSAVWLKNVY